LPGSHAPHPKGTSCGAHGNQKDNQPQISTLLLKVCHKKQENQAAIFIKFSVDAAKNAFTTLVIFVPFEVN
jgi:hypothetical protein